MNKLIVAFSVFFGILTSYGQELIEPIELKIEASSVQNNGVITVQVINNSEDTYWFPWDVSELAYAASVGSTYENEVYILKQEVYNDKLNINEPLLIQADFDSTSLLLKWQEKLKAKQVSDYVVIGPRSKVELKLPFYSALRMAPIWYDCKDAISDGGHYYFLRYDYNSRVVNKVISSTLLDEVNKRGYKIYEEELKSNAVLIKE